MAADREWTTRRLAPDAYERLAATLPASAVWSLLLEVFERRAAARSPAALLRQWRRDGFIRPAPIDQRTFVSIDGHLLAAAADFEALELSPLAPLAACSAVAVASQHKVVSALRGTEVVSDPTNVLALEAAHRLGQDPTHPVHLATCHRCVRAQAVPRRAGFAQHFRIFCLASAGPPGSDRAFLVDALVTHITTHLRALDRLAQHGYQFPGRQLRLLATPDHEPIAERVAAAVTGVPITRSPLTHQYYDGIRFMIDVQDTAGLGVPLIDGGAFDWVGKLAANRRLVYVASGMGAQLIAQLFRSPAAIPEAAPISGGPGSAGPPAG